MQAAWFVLSAFVIQLYIQKYKLLLTPCPSIVNVVCFSYTIIIEILLKARENYGEISLGLYWERKYCEKHCA